MDGQRLCILFLYYIPTASLNIPYFIDGEKTAAAQQAKQLDCIFLIKWYNRCAQVKIK